MDFLLNIIGDINTQTAELTSSVDAVQNWMWSNFLYYALIAAGLYITIRTRGVQWRSIKEMVRVLGDPVAREADGKKSISSFRAFTVSAASRVGTGTVAGVALAIAMGGPVLCSGCGLLLLLVRLLLLRSPFWVSCIRSAVRIPILVVRRTT